MSGARPLHTLKIWGAGVNSPRSYGAEFVFFCLFFVCPSRYVARHGKPRRCVYVLNLGGTGIRPPDSFSYLSNFRSRSRSSSCSTTSGDIFYCSGSRQLNHSSFTCDRSLTALCRRIVRAAASRAEHRTERFKHGDRENKTKPPRSHESKPHTRYKVYRRHQQWRPSGRH